MDAQGISPFRRLAGLAARCLLAVVSGYLTLALLAALLPRLSSSALFERPTAVGIPEEAVVGEARLGYALRPRWQGWFSGPRTQRVVLRTNAEGWRDDDFAPPGAAVGRRVLLLGDSVAFGVGVPCEATFAALLEQRLAPCKVDNCALSGYELNQVVAVAREYLPRTQPSLVLYGLCQNDIREADIAALARTERRPPSELAEALSLRPLSFLVRNLRLRRLATAPSRAGVQGSEAGTLRRWTDPAQRERVRRGLVELRDLCGAARAPLQVVVFPYTFQFDRPVDDPLRAPERHLVEMLKELGIPCLNLHDALEREREPLYLAGDNCHLNEAGHALAARLLGDWLRGS